METYEYIAACVDLYLCGSSRLYLPVTEVLEFNRMREVLPDKKVILIPIYHTRDFVATITESIVIEKP